MIAADLEKHFTSINACLEGLIKERQSPEKRQVPEGRLYCAGRYALLSGGKRIRPLLTLAVGELFDAPLSSLLIPACAIELIHTYSLIHDDLPAMDNDDFRRGQPSLHKAYDEATAILTGDYLLTFAFELLSTAPNLSSEQKLHLITALAKASGALGMIGGQIMDIQNYHDKELVDAKKTGALIGVAVLFGAIVANVSQERYRQLSFFGEKIGLLFQLCDDILDGDESGLEAQNRAQKIYVEASVILQTLPGGNSSLLSVLAAQIINQVRQSNKH